MLFIILAAVSALVATSSLVNAHDLPKRAVMPTVSYGDTAAYTTAVTTNQSALTSTIVTLTLTMTSVVSDSTVSPVVASSSSDQVASSSAEVTSAVGSSFSAVISDTTVSPVAASSTEVVTYTPTPSIETSTVATSSDSHVPSSSIALSSTITDAVNTSAGSTGPTGYQLTYANPAESDRSVYSTISSSEFYTSLSTKNSVESPASDCSLATIMTSSQPDSIETVTVGRTSTITVNGTSTVTADDYASTTVLRANSSTADNVGTIGTISSIITANTTGNVTMPTQPPTPSPWYTNAGSSIQVAFPAFLVVLIAIAGIL